jgi:hypothetical protein
MNLRMKVAYLLFLLLGLTSISSKAQSVYFNYSDGTTAAYNLVDVRKITFVADEMNLQLFDGSVYSWNVSSIGYYQYDENTLGIEELLNRANSWQVGVFPNPANNLLNIHYNLPVEDKIIIALFDLQGKILLETNAGARAKGEHLESLDISSLEAGQYICRISGQKNTISKNIIKQ